MSETTIKVTGNIVGVKTVRKPPKPKGPKRIWDNFQEIGEVQKSASIKFVIAAAVRNGVKYINIREFYKRKKDDVWMPGRDGITIPILVPLEENTKQIEPYKDMIKLLTDAAEVLKDIELYDEEHAVYAKPKEETSTNA